MIIELKKWTKENKETLKEICNKIDRKYLSNRVPFPYKDEDAIYWLNYVAENEEKNGIFRAIVIDGVICGNISVEKKGDIYCKEGILGYFLLTEYWRKGIMTKATEIICEIAFKDLDIIKISATTFDQNIASQKVLEKNKFSLEGIRKKSIYKNDNFYDEYIYGKIKTI